MVDIGIISYGVHIPHWRLSRVEIGQVLATSAGRGHRAVASWDEDTTTMAVAAARICLDLAPGSHPDQLLLSTAQPAYVDKTNACAVQAALDVPQNVLVADLGGATRSGVATLSLALTAAAAGLTTLVAFAETRSGSPGSFDEASGGDGAAALLVGAGDNLLAVRIGEAHVSEEFLDRWRVPSSTSSQVWEERFGEQIYMRLAQRALSDALKTAGVETSEVDRLVVSGLHSRAVKAVVKASGVAASAVVDDLSQLIGIPGTAQAAIGLACALEQSKPDQVIVSVVLADGASVTVWRAGEALAAWRPAGRVVDAASGGAPVPYSTFLTWTGQLVRATPRRPEPAPAYAPPSSRHADWKFGLKASRCNNCATVHVPAGRVCRSCHSIDQMSDEPLSRQRGSVITFTIDRLAFTPSPPLVAAVVDLDGGGRLTCELTDVDPAAVRVGDRVELTFRRLGTSAGIHNYFWKARPVALTLSQDDATEKVGATT